MPEHHREPAPPPAPPPWFGQQAAPGFPAPGYGPQEAQRFPAAGGCVDPPTQDFPVVGYGEPPPRRRSALAASVGAAVVVLAAAVAGWYFATGPGHSGGAGGQHAVPAPSAPSSAPDHAGPAPSVLPSAPRSSASTVAGAYEVGSCFDEQQGSGPGRVQLQPVSCASDRSVFVINKVVASATDCDAAAAYHQHGSELPDRTANVAYCVSLVVPADACFVLGATEPIARAACGSGPDVVRVLAIESAPDARSACADKTNPDVWFFQSPASGQFACVSRPVPPGTSVRPTG